MVKNMDNYQERRSDERFRKWDNMIRSNSNDRKVSIILTVGVIICSILMVVSIVSQMGKPEPLKYDYGLNMSYSPQSSMFFIDYTNPNSTVTNMTVTIQVPFNDNEHITVYSTSSSVFPSNISYKPYNKELSHTVLVVLAKPSGNYTYTYNVIPSEEEKMYDGVTKYTEMLNNQISKINITS